MTLMGLACQGLIFVSRVRKTMATCSQQFRSFPHVQHVPGTHTIITTNAELTSQYSGRNANGRLRIINTTGLDPIAPNLDARVSSQNIDRLASCKSYSASFAYAASFQPTGVVSLIVVIRIEQ